MPPRWGVTDRDGIRVVRLLKFKYFKNYVDDVLLGHGYVYRGHRRPEWLLESTLDRLIGDRALPRQFKNAIAREHLARFIKASRGRRGPNPPLLNDPDDWWALGQHFGLATPLLDWTESPFIAAFFALEKEDRHRGCRVVFALHQKTIEKLSARGGEKQVIKFISPQSDENQRLVSQQGLFTKLPLGRDLESWVRERAVTSEEVPPALVRIEIPNKDRALWIKQLNSMNISRLALFPDLSGASQYANLVLKTAKP